MTSDLWILALKAVLAGTFVVLLSVLAQVLRPKMFAGLFAGAPAVASVSIAITAAIKPPAALQGTRGMIAGAVAMIVCCAVATLVIPRTGALLGSALAWVAWAVVAFGAGIALIAGVVGMRFGPRLGGLFLAFPAVLPASLTLLEKKDGRDKADVDALGAILGSVGMLVFAFVAFLAMPPLGGFAAAAAWLTWICVSVSLFFAVRALLTRV